MNLLIVNNCQTAGFAAALARMAGLRRVGVATVYATDGYDDLRKRIGGRLHGCDALVIHKGFESHARRLAAELGLGDLRILPMPWVEFDAFHPDLTLSARRDSGAPFAAYQSAIGLWAFNQGLTPARAARLFCGQTYEALGYFARWEPAVARLRGLFQGTFAEPHFDPFFLSAKRGGCFMHLHFHPKIALLVQLARHAADALGLPIRSPIRDGELPDALNEVIWPVYPEIGEALGVRGAGLGWRMASGRFRLDGVEPFLAFTYQQMTSQGVCPGDLLPSGFPLQDLDERMEVLAGRLL